MITDPKGRERIIALSRILKPIHDEQAEKRLFDHRGFSDRTVQRIVECGIDAPERLLFMSDQELKKIPGVGVSSMKEIRAYRERFILRGVEQ